MTGARPDLDAALAAARTLVQAAGGDLNRPDMAATPARVVKALLEMTSGRFERAEEILATRFPALYDGLVVLPGIELTSLCEHHLLPFSGIAAVGYLPAGDVVGVSKLARLVLCFARRLQIQERLTTEIGEALWRYLRPLGAAVQIEAAHQCMGCRGVRQPRARMVTSAYRGSMREAFWRDEFLRVARGSAG
jgi:GTP cyclohydrolase I